MGKLDGRVAFITGAARGQGRSHAVRLAREGASIIAADICAQIDTVPFPLATPEDLAETVDAVEREGGKILARQADVRDLPALEALVADGIAAFGRLDIVIANAGTVNGTDKFWELTERQFQDQLDTNTTGVWKTVKAATSYLVEQGHGGSIIITTSVADSTNEPNVGHYSVSKFGALAIMLNFAAELAPHGIRVNAVAPTTVHSKMVDNPYMIDLFTNGREGATWADCREALSTINALNTPTVDCDDVSNAVLYLASDESRYVTGSRLAVDAGATIPFKVHGG